MHVNTLINSEGRVTKRNEEENRKMGDREAELRGKDGVCLYVIIMSYIGASSGVLDLSSGTFKQTV